MKNHITAFNFETMNNIESFIVSSNLDHILEYDLRDLLCTENVNIVLVGINRLQSMLLCELNDSYIQQSQRYVPITNSSINILDLTPENIKNDASTLINSAIALYKEMTYLKDPNKKGRPTSEDFIHRISYDDARSILPLCVTTNMSITTSADKLAAMFKLFNKYPIVFNELKNELLSYITPNLARMLISVGAIGRTSELNKFDKYFINKFNELTIHNNVIELNTQNINEQIAIGALTSQNSDSPVSVYNNWKDDKEEKSKKLISNVIGYGHTAILEQARTTFAMQCSISTFHQVIRHRLQKIRREPLTNIIYDIDRPFIIPKSIRNNEYFYRQTLNLMAEYRNLINEYSKKYSKEFLMQFLPNCVPIRFIVSSNIRNDNWIFRERLCFTAQDEIRSMYEKKFAALNDTNSNVVKYGLPPCVLNNTCKEGRMNCGKLIEAKDYYSEYIE